MPHATKAVLVWAAFAHAIASSVVLLVPAFALVHSDFHRLPRLFIAPSEPLSTGEFRASIRAQGTGSRVDIRDASIDICEKLRSMDTQKSPAAPWLLFAPIKKQRIKVLVEKATELGVARLIPVITDRTQEVPDDQAMMKFGSTIIEAAEQCERLTLPDMDVPRSLTEILDTWAHDSSAKRPIFYCQERATARPLLKALAAPSLETGAAFLVGPEGGFTPAECELLEAKDFVYPVTLGETILRSETAAVYALSCWNAFQHSAM